MSIQRVGPGKVGGQAGVASAVYHPILNMRGSAALKKTVDFYSSTQGPQLLVRGLHELARGAKDTRVRYASLLLLDKVLGNNSQLKQSGISAPVSQKLAEIARDREAMTRWYELAMLPKTDQHVHIDGSVREETVVKLASAQGIDLAHVLEKSKATPGKDGILRDVPALPREYTVDDISSLSRIRSVQPDFLKMLFLGFDFAIAVMQTQDALARTAYELVEDSAREGVMHLTAITAPRLHMHGGLSYTAVAEAIIDGLERGTKDFGVTWELGLGIYRGVYTTLFPDHPQAVVDLARDLAQKNQFRHQIAIDVVGAEFQQPLVEFRSLFESLRDSNVILRAHAGETMGAHHNLPTALGLGCKRVGHGIQLFRLGEAAVRRIINSGMVFEVSPDSNLKCHCIGEGDGNVLGNHSIARLIDTVPVTLCTDDRTVMDTDNIRQMLNLEAALGWQFIAQRRVTPLSRSLAFNGFKSINDPGKSRQHLREIDPVVLEMNRLMDILAS